MREVSRILSFGIFLLLVVMLGCQPRSEVESLIKSELKSGVRNDSLFVGVSFGMESQEFYDHCWEINRQGIVKEGAENMSVLYEFEYGGYKIEFNFYPSFEKGVAARYNCSFSYTAWAPWNKQLQSDDLIAVLPEVLVNWYGGNEFIRQKREGKTFFYKVDGNRMIELYVKDEKRVHAIFTDVSAFVD